MMEEKVIKRSPKKIIWNALFGLFQCFSSCYLSIIFIRIRKRGPDFIR